MYITKSSHEYAKANGQGLRVHKKPPTDEAYVEKPDGYAPEYYDWVETQVEHQVVGELDGVTEMVTVHSLQENSTDKAAYESAQQAEYDAKLNPLKDLKSRLLALSAADMQQGDGQDAQRIVDAIIDLRDAMAALEKEIFDI